MMTGESLAAADDNIVRWFESEFGGTVVELARQTRWRPVWFATVDRDGERFDLGSKMMLPEAYSQSRM